MMSIERLEAYCRINRVTCIDNMRLDGVIRTHRKTCHGHQPFIHTFSFDYIVIMPVLVLYRRYSFTFCMPPPLWFLFSS